MKLILAALAALVTLPAVAQESVVLGGWGLPEGTTIRSEQTTSFRGTGRAMGEAFSSKSASEDAATTVIDSVADGRLMRAVQTVDLDERRFWMDGRLTSSSPGSIEGRQVAIERTDEGWTRRPLGWRPDRDERTSLDEPITLDDAEYPTHPLSVGETYVVPDDLLPLVYLDATDAPRRLTVRVDSLGTRDGGPVAYLTQEVDVTIGTGEGNTMHMVMTAQIVRRLDWRLDIETHWYGEVEHRGRGFRLSGPMSYRSTQAVTFPD